jgi:hypothetical protein
MIGVREFGPFVGMLVTQLPFYLVWLVGLILAIVNWSRYPKPALITTLALGMMFLSSVVYAYLWSESIRHDWADGVPDYSWIQVISWTRSIIHVLCYSLLFWAIFGWRQTFSPRRFDRRDEPDDREPDEVEGMGDPDTGIRKQPKRMGD